MSQSIYEEIANRTNGDVYLGVVGPVRVGKSTFIKKVMESLVIPNIADEQERMRAMDELPQSAPGLTIMTAEPKFVPANGTLIQLQDSTYPFRVRLTDCVGYVVEGTKGYEDENGPKLVQTPWNKELIPFQEAARIGTDKVIRDHSTIGIVVTSDGSINQLERAKLEQVEQEIVKKMFEIGKPFVLVVNSRFPNSTETKELVECLEERYNVPVIPISIEDMSIYEIQHILQEALFEFPIIHFDLMKPEWMDVLDDDDEYVVRLNQCVNDWTTQISKMRDAEDFAYYLSQEDFIKEARITDILPGTGEAVIEITLEDDCFDNSLNRWLQAPIDSKKDWLQYVKDNATIRQSFSRFQHALDEALHTGYGVSLPMIDDFEPQIPELIQENKFYGVQMKAKAPSIHMIRIDMEAEFSPLIGSEFHSKQLLHDLRDAYENDRATLWNTSLFGTPLHEMMRESIRFKTDTLSNRAKKKMQETIQQMVNEGNRGIVTLIL